MQSGPNCKKLVEGSAPSPWKPELRSVCSIFLRQMRFRQWAEMKEAVMPDSCVLHAILAWRLSLFVKITTALALAGRGLGAEPTNKLLQKLLTLHCLQLLSRIRDNSGYPEKRIIPKKELSRKVEEKTYSVRIVSWFFRDNRDHFSAWTVFHFERITNLWSVPSLFYFSAFAVSSISGMAFSLRHFFIGSCFPHSSQV